MKNLKKNPFFYLSLVLGFAVVLEAAGIVNAAWTAPAQNPPLGNPAQPLDTSAAAQTKTGGLTVMDPNYTYGVKMSPGGNLVFGPINTQTNSITPQAEIAIYNGVLSYTNDNAGHWNPIGTGSIGNWPISIPTSGPQGMNGFFGFQLANTGWTGFDLSGNAANRLILGVSNTQVSSSSNIFDVEAPGNNWQHMLELRADGSAMFKGSVVASGFSDSSGPVPPYGTMCGMAVPKIGAVFLCDGVDPGQAAQGKASCPIGWTPATFPMDSYMIKNAENISTCVYTGSNPNASTGSGGTYGNGGVITTHPQ